MPMLFERPLFWFAAIGMLVASLTGSGADTATAGIIGAAQKRGTIAFAVSIPAHGTTSRASSAARPGPRYVSPGTLSIQILTDGLNPVTANLPPNSSVISVTFIVAAGTHIFSVKTYAAPNAGGSVLSLNSTGPVVVKPIGTTVVRLTLDGVVQNIGLYLAQPIPPVGVRATIPLDVELADAAGATIIGPAPFYNGPIMLTTSDAANGTLSKTVLSSPSDAAGVTVTYSGANVNNITFSARASGAGPLVKPAVLFIAPIPNAHKLFVSDDLINNAAAYSTQLGYPFLGRVGTPSVGFAPPDHPAVAVDQSAGKIYVMHDPFGGFGSSLIDVYGTGTGYPLLATIPDSGYPTAIAVDPTTHQLFIRDANPAVINVYSYSAANGYALVTTIPGAGNGGNMAVDPIAGKLYVEEETAPQTIDVFSTRSGNALLGVIGGFSNTPAMAVDAAAGKLYTAEYAPAGEVKVLGTTAGYPVQATIGVLAYPEALAVDTVTHQLYVADQIFSSSTVQVFGAAAGYPLSAQFLYFNNHSFVTSMAVLP